MNDEKLLKLANSILGSKYQKLENMHTAELNYVITGIISNYRFDAGRKIMICIFKAIVDILLEEKIIYEE